MANPTNDLPAANPDNVPETICIGKFNVSMTAPLATLTFTHARPKVGPPMDNGVIDLESVVRARIVTSVENLVALRDPLNKIIQNPSTATSAGGSSRLN